MMAKLIVAFCASRPNAGEWSRKYLEKPAEVLSWLKGGPQVDVAILDLQMPVVDGCQLAREIHSFEKYKGFPPHSTQLIASVQRHGNQLG
jgi:CheY-like chemotaxis protein